MAMLLFFLCRSWQVDMAVRKCLLKPFGGVAVLVNAGVAEIQPFELLQLKEAGNACVGDSYALKCQSLQVFKLREMWNDLVR